MTWAGRMIDYLFGAPPTPAARALMSTVRYVGVGHALIAQEERLAQGQEVTATRLPMACLRLNLVKWAG